MGENPLRVNFLEGVPESHHAAIVDRGLRALLKPGQILFREGDPAQKCYLVMRGRLKLIKLHALGKEAIIRYIAKGELTAAISVFSAKAYPVSAEAVGSTEVVGWDRQAMMKLMLEYPPMAINMLRIAVDRIEELQDCRPMAADPLVCAETVMDLG